MVGCGEATTGFEPVIKVLQTSALPLGYVAQSNPDSIRALLGGPERRKPKGFRVFFKLKFPLGEVKRGTRFSLGFPSEIRVGNIITNLQDDCF